MIGPSEFRELVSGRRTGPLAVAARGMLGALEIPYAWAMRLRNAMFDLGWFQQSRVGVPIISVGNLTVGGTGKTPVVEWLARWFIERGAKVGLLSRGYGSGSSPTNDEALELAQALPGTPHVLDPDRVRGAQRLVVEYGAKLIVLDDAFQHRQIARDLDIVLLDALEPFGYDRVFPRGTLREPFAGIARAHVVILTRADRLDTAAREAIRDRVRRHAPRAIWVESVFAPKTLLDASGQERPLDFLLGKPIAAFCGIGNPAGFYHSLQSCGYTKADQREFSDHYPYPDSALAELSDWADRLDVAAAVCTRKDLVKIGYRWRSGKPLFSLVGGIKLTAGEADLQAALLPFVARTTAAKC